jgi:Ser/Thr protein kinase RdoA (MazF antagonist)
MKDRSKQISVELSIPNQTALAKLLSEIYDIKFSKIQHHRTMVGSLYILWEADKRFVFKLYRKEDSQAAMQSTRIFNFLVKKQFLVPNIIPTQQDQDFVTLQMPEGSRFGVLLQYISGSNPLVTKDIDRLAELTANLHKKMISYPTPLPKLQKSHYIDRYLQVVKDLGFAKDKIAEMETFGDSIWQSVKDLPRKFAHGDLHTGNMIKTRNDKIFLYDFDIASKGFAMLDVATICDCTDFNYPKKEEIEKTKRNFEKFYLTYAKYINLTKSETDSFFQLIALRHFELNGTIPHYHFGLTGNHWFNQTTFNRLYNWMKTWQEYAKSGLFIL